MFNFNYRFRYIKTSTPENDNPGVWSADVNFFSDDVDFVPFTRKIDYTTNPEPVDVSDLVKFQKGEFGKLLIIGGSQQDILNRIDEIYARLKNQLAAGAGQINYDTKPLDFSETSEDGINWD